MASRLYFAPGEHLKIIRDIIHRRSINLIFCSLFACLLGSPQHAEAIGVGGGVSYVIQEADGYWNLDAGPGVILQFALQGDIFGLRAEFNYADMEHKPGPFTTGTEHADLYGGSVALKIRPLGMMDFPVQPFGIVGGGGQHLESNVFGIPDASGPTGKLGAGVDFLFGKHVSLTVEGDWQPFFYWVDAPGYIETDARTMHLVILSANVGFHF